jgi:hypothetical protein
MNDEETRSSKSELDTFAKDLDASYFSILMEPRPNLRKHLLYLFQCESNSSYPNSFDQLFEMVRHMKCSSYMHNPNLAD